MAIVFNSGIVFSGNVSGSGISGRKPVRAASTVNGALATAFEAGDTLDGVTLAVDNRILLKNQTTGSENGIYIVQASGAPIRSDDFYDGGNAAGITIIVEEGTTNADTVWLCTNDSSSSVIGTDSLVFIQTAGLGANGDMFGPASSADNTIPRFNGTDGKLLKISGVTVDNSDNITGIASLTATNSVSSASMILTGANNITISPSAQSVGAATLSITDLAGVSGAIAITNLAQTLTNKTIAAGGNTISGLQHGTEVDNPTSGVHGVTGNIVGTTDSQTLTNKQLTSPTMITPRIADISADHFYIFNPSELIANRNINLPVLNADDTMVLRTTTQTLQNKTISGSANTISDINASNITSGTLAVAQGGTGVGTLTSGNVLVGAGTSAVTTTKVAPTGEFVGTTDSQTLTNKALTSPAISTISNTGTLTLPTSTDTLVGRATTDTLTNKTLTAPRIGTSILDTNGNELLLLTATGSAVNELTLANAATGTNPTISATGGDTNIGINLTTKGSGAVNIISADTGTSGTLRIQDNTGGQYVGITAAATTTTYTVTMPAAQGGSNEVLVNNGSGILSWAVPSSPITNSIQTATTDASTTSGTYVTVPSMTVTPAAGTYLVMFSSSGLVSRINTTTTYAIHLAGTIVQHSERNVRITAGNATESVFTLHTQSVTTANGSQAIDVRYLTSAGTFTMHERSLILVRLA